jgi:hypothetical protein
VKDRAKLDALLQSAEVGARQGIAFAEKAEIDSSVLSMIYERAAYLRIQNDDASALAALRNYWRCALLGNMCWQLAHTRKAQPVDLTNDSSAASDKNKADDKTNDKVAAKTDEKTDEGTKLPAASADKTLETAHSHPEPAVTNAVTEVISPDTTTPPPPPPTPSLPPAITNALVEVKPPIAPVAATNLTTNPAVPRALPAAIDSSGTNATPPPTSTPLNPPAPDMTSNETNATVIPVAPVAKAEDYSGGNEPPVTNAPSIIGPAAPLHPPDNADGHAAAFP